MGGEEEEDVLLGEDFVEGCGGEGGEEDDLVVD